GETVLLGREDGVVEAWNADGEPQGTVVALPGPIRSLRTFGDDLAVVHEGGWWSSRGRSGSEALVDLWLTADGSVHAEGCRVVFRDGETERSVDLGEPVLALAVEDAGTPDEWPMVVVAAGRQIWRLELEGPTCLGTRRGGRAMITIGQERAAWSTSRTTAALLDMRGEQNGPTYLTYANRYSDNDEDELALADLCVVDHELVAAALENGGMNLLGPEGAMKADEFPGEPVRRWIFFYLGSILMAG
ncbi:MAG: hypothetical protein KC457_19290, partial [Myxococcales bacterium]|nr:hypothetical protein [Myxococcales bacterium]